MGVLELDGLLVRASWRTLVRRYGQAPGTGVRGPARDLLLG
ncbi:hypothetical protein [Streptomyces bluensis]